MIYLKAIINSDSRTWIDKQLLALPILRIRGAQATQ
jgi:hypothetical protein